MKMLTYFRGLIKIKNNIILLIVIRINLKQNDSAE